jgi:hypothetical protein
MKLVTEPTVLAAISLTAGICAAQERPRRQRCPGFYRVAISGR